MPPRKHEAHGQKFGRWTAISEAAPIGKSRVWRCQCDCGTEKDVYLTSLVSGKSTSCGCFQQEQVVKAITTHGMSKSPEFWAWAQMIDRCHNEKSQSYGAYGGRGISVCEQWRSSFQAFYSYVGSRPSSKHSIDRIDNDGNYEPGNCRWATRAQQDQNTSRIIRLEHDGRRLTLREWSKETGIPYRVLSSRHKARWATERMLTQPVGSRHDVKFHEPPDRFGPPVGEKVESAA